MINATSTDLDIASLQLPKTTTRKDPKSLGQEDFLALMTQQLQNQDPLKPMDNGEFLGQMAQFSTVNGIADMTKSITSLTESFNSGQALQAASMVGRTVLTEGNTGSVGPGKALKGAVDLPEASANAVVRIYTTAGQLVRELPLGSQQAGMSNFSWDGTMANGQSAPAGTYKVTASLGNRSGDTALGTYIASKVESVTLSASGGSSLIRTETGASLPLSQVKAVM
jgi:flagellar basal-body rod modification protein FlgD